MAEQGLAKGRSEGKNRVQRRRGEEKLEYDGKVKYQQGFQGRRKRE